MFPSVPSFLFYCFPKRESIRMKKRRGGELSVSEPKQEEVKEVGKLK